MLTLGWVDFLLTLGWSRWDGAYVDWDGSIWLRWDGLLTLG